MPIPSSRQVGTTSASTSRLHRLHSSCTAVMGCTCADDAISHLKTAISHRESAFPAGYGRRALKAASHRTQLSRKLIVYCQRPLGTSIVQNIQQALTYQA